MTWTITRGADGVPTSLSWSSSHYGVTRAYDRHQLAAIREAERDVLAAWPDIEPTAAQVASLAGWLTTMEVAEVWAQCGRVWTP